jgi:hypothetical protein
MLASQLRLLAVLALHPSPCPSPARRRRHPQTASPPPPPARPPAPAPPRTPPASRPRPRPPATHGHHRRARPGDRPHRPQLRRSHDGPVRGDRALRAMDPAQRASRSISTPSRWPTTAGTTIRTGWSSPRTCSRARTATSIATSAASTSCRPPSPAPSCSPSRPSRATRPRSCPTASSIKIPPRHKLVAGVHLLNLSSARPRQRAAHEPELSTPRDVEVIVAPFRLNYEDLAIPAQKQSRFTGECMLADQYEAKAGVPLDLKLYHVLPHYHYLGNYFSVEIIGGPRDGEQIYLHEGFNADGNGRTYDPPIDLTGADRPALHLRLRQLARQGDQLRHRRPGDVRHARPRRHARHDERLRRRRHLSRSTPGRPPSVHRPVLDDRPAEERRPGHADPRRADAPLYVPPASPATTSTSTPSSRASTRTPTRSPSSADPRQPARAPCSTRAARSPAATAASPRSPPPRRRRPPRRPARRADPRRHRHAARRPRRPRQQLAVSAGLALRARDDGDAAHIHMPYNAPTLLDDRLVAKLRAWIEAGANND